MRILFNGSLKSFREKETKTEEKTTVGMSGCDIELRQEGQSAEMKHLSRRTLLGIKGKQHSEEGIRQLL